MADDRDESNRDEEHQDEVRREEIQALVEAGYDELTERFQMPFVEDFESKPIERQLLEDFANRVGDRRVLDIGCGHGPVCRFLHHRGVAVRGIDLSAVTVERARELNPEIDFDQMDLLNTTFESGYFGGITSFYSLVHMPLSDVRVALRELARLLGPPGVLLVAVYQGDGEKLLNPGEGYAVKMYRILFQLDELRDLLEESGFRVHQLQTRPHRKGEIRLDRLFALASLEM